MKRTFVIGDIHGALKAIKQVISSIKPRKTDTLIFLGDYVDGWPESAQVLEFLIELGKEYNCIFLKGNHDLNCESWLGGNPESTDWSEKRGLATITSYELLEERHKLKHLQFLSRLPLYHIDEQNRLFLHAGFKNSKGPQFETPSKNLLIDRSMWESALTMDKRIKSHPSLLPKKLKLFKEIFIGHTPTLIYDITEPMKACNIINMDTGAGFHGKLSAMEIHTSELIQSDIVQTLYPDYTGRNK